MIENTLDKLAEKILGIDEASLANLWDKYKSRMDSFDRTRDWEKSVIIFFIINSVRAKNHIFNEQIMNVEKKQTKPQKVLKANPDLKLVK